MALTKENIAETVDKFKKSDGDTGSAEVQVALLSSRIEYLSEHLKKHKKDNHSRRGLIAIVSNRRKLLDYLKKSEFSRYKTLIGELGLRK